MLFTSILLLVLLVCCWLLGDQRLVTKLLFTALVVASFGLCFIPTEPGRIAWPALTVSAQAVLAIVIGGSTFGMGWLTRKR